MTFDPEDPASWPEGLQGVDSNDLRKFADALMCAVMAIEEGATSRIEFQTDPRVMAWVRKALAAMRADGDGTDE